MQAADFFVDEEALRICSMALSERLKQADAVSRAADPQSGAERIRKEFHCSFKQVCPKPETSWPS